MSTPANKAVVERVYTELWNLGDLTVADDLFDPTFRDVDAPARVLTGPDGIRDFVTENKARFPDLRYDLEALIAEGDAIVALWTATGTNSGPLHTRSNRTLPPTGKRVTWRGATVYRLSGGKIVSLRTSQNLLGVFRDLGLIIDAA